jgi:phage-related protein
MSKKPNSKPILKVSFYKSNMILLRGFVKKSQETPEREKAIVKKRLSDLKQTEQRKSD